MSEKMYLIGETAERTGCTIKAIRYYDDVNIVKPSSHTEGGHRLYSTQDIQNLTYVNALRYLDFDISDVRDIINGDLPIKRASRQKQEALTLDITIAESRLAILESADSKDDSSSASTIRQQLIDSISELSLDRSQFIITKIEEIIPIIDYSEKLENNYSNLFMTYFTNNKKLTAEERVIWQQLQNVLNDPRFLDDLKNIHRLHKKKFADNSIDYDFWSKEVSLFEKRIIGLSKQKELPESSKVQSLIVEMAHFFSDKELTVDDYFNHIIALETPKYELFQKLLLQLNPEWEELQNQDKLLFDAAKWYLSHNETI